MKFFERRNLLTANISAYIKENVGCLKPLSNAPKLPRAISQYSGLLYDIANISGAVFVSSYKEYLLFIDHTHIGTK